MSRYVCRMALAIIGGGIFLGAIELATGFPQMGLGTFAINQVCTMAVGVWIWKAKEQR